jgi:hypothetical protein
MVGVSQPTPARPRQVTLAAWLIMVGSAVVVAMVFDRVAGLHSMETRESVEKFLAEPPGNDLGVDVQGAIAMLRTLSMVAAGCATAAGILGYQVLRRSRSARLALTVLAVPLFLTGLVTGGFVSSVVAASAVMLWLQPARDWFDGVTRPASTGGSGPAARKAASPTAAATSPFDRGATTALPPAVWPDPHPATSTKRPATVVWACVLTWISSAVIAIGMIVSVVAIAVRPGLMLDEVHRQNPDLAQQGISDQLLTVATYVMAAVVLLWCLSAVVLAVLVWRRVAWARIVLVVCAATCAALSLLGSVVGAFLLVFPLAASVVTIALLLRPDTRPWFDQSPR